MENATTRGGNWLTGREEGDSGPQGGDRAGGVLLFYSTSSLLIEYMSWLRRVFFFLQVNILKSRKIFECLLRYAYAFQSVGKYGNEEVLRDFFFVDVLRMDVFCVTNIRLARDIFGQKQEVNAEVLEGGWVG